MGSERKTGVGLFRLLFALATLVILVAVALAVATGFNYNEPVRSQRTVQFEKAAQDQSIAREDKDGDDVFDVVENALLSTDRLKADSDGDGVPDDWERAFSLNPNSAEDGATDPDRDGLNNKEEYEASVKLIMKTGYKGTVIDPKRGLDPLEKDKDGDALPDGWEYKFGLDPLTAAGLEEDLDGDGLSNLAEYNAGSDPTKFDTDGDGLSDGLEINKYNTSPIDSDTDRDGMPDWWEIRHRLQPTNANDRFGDGDTPQSDALVNLLEFNHDTDPNAYDTDGDTIPDGWEVQYGLDPTSFADGTADPDGDGADNKKEYRMIDSIYQLSTDPLNPDTEGDGLLDGEEMFHGTNPFRADTDVDTLKDGDEIHGTYGYFTNPLTKDSDGDQLSDGDEIFQTRTDPTQFDTDSDRVDDGREWKYWLERADRGRILLESTGQAPDNIRNLYGSDQNTIISQLMPTGNIDGDKDINILDKDSDEDRLDDGDEIINTCYLEDKQRRDPMEGKDNGVVMNPPCFRSDPANPDTDADTLPDGWEWLYKAPCGYTKCPNPLDSNDANDDPDDDGVVYYQNVTQVNGQTYVTGFYTSPPTRTMPNWVKNNYTKPECTNCRFTNKMEYGNSTNPLTPDRDCDLIPDGWEAFDSHRKDDGGGILRPSPSEKDSNLDLDDDGFDIDRNGERTGDEMFTTLEEWWFFTHPNNVNSDNDVFLDERSGKEYFLNDGTEVYINQRTHPDLYKNPTVGRSGNGEPDVGSYAAPTKRTGKFEGCKPDYSLIKVLSVGEGIVAAEDLRARPPMGPFDILVVLGALGALFVYRRLSNVKAQALH